MDNYTVISTKVNTMTLEYLKRICAKKGITLYDMLQMMCDCIVRYMSDKTNLTEEIERAMAIFESMEGWKGAFNLADENTEYIVDEAIYFIGDRKKKGTRAVMVERPYFGESKQTVNIQEVLEHTLNNIIPTRYQRLRTKAIKQGYTNILDMIDAILSRHEEDDDLANIRAEFEDCTRDDYGRLPNEHRYISRHHKTVDDEPRQTKITFEADDLPEGEI